MCWINVRTTRLFLDLIVVNSRSGAGGAQLNRGGEDQEMTGEKWTAIAASALLAGCGSEGLSTSDVQAAAKERVREKLALTPQSTLFTETFVGRPVDGDTTLCGTVEGKRADGTSVPPRRFIAATEPGRWLKFGAADGPTPPTHSDKFANWTEICGGEQEIR